MAIVKPEKCNPKSETFMADVLERMENMIEGKLSNLKTFIPILFTIITSVIAFLFVEEANDKEILRGYLLVLAVLLISFIFLIISYFVKNHYKAVKLETDTEFSPYNLKSYCFISDDEFIRKISDYAERPLSDKELISANFIKQKINEYATRRVFSSIALSIVIIGTVLTIVIFLIGVFAPELTS